MRRIAAVFAAMGLLAALSAPGASADFGFKELSVRVLDAQGGVSMQAGTHPYALRTSLALNTLQGENSNGEEKTFVDGAMKDLEVELPAGLVGNPRAVPACSTLDFLKSEKAGPEGLEVPACGDSAALGYVKVNAGNIPIPVYNLEPPPGVAAKLGFWVSPVPITVEVGVNPKYPHNVIAKLANAAQAIEVFTAELTIWGNPADSVHDDLRGRCAVQGDGCEAGVPAQPFLTLPRSCTGPLETIFRITPWWVGDPLDPKPGSTVTETVLSDDGAEPPNPEGMSGCDSLLFEPELEAVPNTDQASSPTGLEVKLEVEDEGLVTSGGTAKSDIRRTVVTLPPGVTLNPSVAEGLRTCSRQDLEREQVDSAPGEGCPEASKVGSAEVETPILRDEVFQGQLFVATQDDPVTTEPGAENPFDSLVAVYLVIKHPGRGILVKQAGKVEPNPKTGQIETIFEDLPQFPLSQVRLRLRSGARSPLISPERCGTYATKAEFTPWSDPSRPIVKTSTFRITRGVGGGLCPPAGPPPFIPGFVAGSINNQGGAHSPFYMQLTRRDGDQDLTRFSAVLPPGLVAKLAGTTQCSEAAIATARTKRGRDELAVPSCPASSHLGRVVAGAGIGSQLTYVPGSFYLAGPVGRVPLSVVAIVPAVAGPFDVGTVVVRQALQVNPRTGEVRVDGGSSEPLPHMLAGIPLKVRDVRVFVDRPNFTLNPTSCNPMRAGAEIWGGGSDPISTLDDVAFVATARYQAAGCGSLEFDPRISLRLEGATQRGGFPRLRTVFTPREGDANLSELMLRLPRSAFLEQAHFRTICTRVQYAAEACPAGSIYGRARAFTPLLEQPLEGPIYLRSSSNKLPDMVFDLRGLINIEAVAKVDSHRGGIRATISGVPDAPISKVVVNMQAGKKGLIINSRDLCRQISRANALLTAQNAKQRDLKPMVKAVNCNKKSKRSAKARR